MARNYLPLRGEGREYRLRLTVRGQRNLTEEFGEDILQTVFLAPTDSRRMCALLREALNWPGSGNEITDGEEFYDLLVDWGWHGQERFGWLAFDLAAASGLIADQQAEILKRRLHEAVQEAFSGRMADRQQEEKGEAEPPFPRN